MDLTSFMTGLFNKNNRIIQNMPEISKDEPPITTTIRVPSKVRRFYEIQAENYGISLQAMINLTLTSVAETSLDHDISAVRLIGERFFDLFKMHDVPVVDIPFILKDYSITLPILADKAKLLDSLTPQLIDHLAKLFNVKVDWLNGRIDEPTEKTGAWYKNIRFFCKHLTDLKILDKEVTVYFVKNKSDNLEMAYTQGDNKHAEDVGIIVEIQNKIEGGYFHNTYEWWGSESWNYPHHRQQLKTIILFCEKMRRPRYASFDGNIDLSLSYCGRNLEKDVFDKLKTRWILPVTALNVDRYNSSWQPDHYVNSGYPGCVEPEELEGVKTLFDEYKLHKFVDGSYWMTEND